MYTILNFNKHPLLNSILFNNYKAINLVNNKDLLKPRSFRLAKLDKVVKYKSLSLLISRYSKRVLKNLLNSLKGLRTKDLVLYNVVVVKGFFINIVLKACLIKSRV